jgi:hypothetical protein
MAAQPVKLIGAIIYEILYVISEDQRTLRTPRTIRTPRTLRTPQTLRIPRGLRT